MKRLFLATLLLIGCSGKMADGAATSEDGDGGRNPTHHPSTTGFASGGDKFGAGGSTTAVATGHGGAVATGGSTPVVTGTVIELTAEQASELSTGACDGFVSTSDVLPSYAEFLIDASDSMNAPLSGATITQWQSTKQSIAELLTTVIASAPSRSFRLGLRLVPIRSSDETTVTSCVRSFPEVVFGAPTSSLAAQSNAIMAVLDATTPQGKTPLLDAYLAAQAELLTAAPDLPSSIILVTDGNASLNQGCTEPCLTSFDAGGDPTAVSGCPVRKLWSLADSSIAEPQPIVDAIDSAYQTHRIRTYVVGTAGSELNRAWLSKAAILGRTAKSDCDFATTNHYCHIDVPAGDDLVTQLKPYFMSADSAPERCVIPLAPIDVQDPFLLHVLLRIDAGIQLLTLDNRTTTDCVEGFRVTQDTAELCAKTCEQVRASTFFEITVLESCPERHPTVL